MRSWTLELCQGAFTDGFQGIGVPRVSMLHQINSRVTSTWGIPALKEKPGCLSMTPLKLSICRNTIQSILKTTLINSLKSNSCLLGKFLPRVKSDQPPNPDEFGVLAIACHIALESHHGFHQITGPSWGSNIPCDHKWPTHGDRSDPWIEGRTWGTFLQMFAAIPGEIRLYQKYPKIVLKP